MEPFMERLIEEKSDLEARRAKLNAFIGSDTFDKLDPTQQTLLKVQFWAMKTYLACLEERIELLQK